MHGRQFTHIMNSVDWMLVLLQPAAICMRLVGTFINQVTTEDFEGITWFQGKRRGNQSLLRKFKEWTGENWQTINFQLG